MSRAELGAQASCVGDREQLTPKESYPDRIVTSCVVVAREGGKP